MSVLVVLCRSFFSRFFESETVTSDIQLRQTLIWVLAFLLAPGILLLLQLLPQFQFVLIRAQRLHSFDIVDDLLEWIAFVFVTYSMITTGLITVFVWDALTFDHRDAMVLGPLPLRGRTIVLGKLLALGAFLLLASVPVNLVNASFFALETSGNLGVGVLTANFGAHLASTVMGAAFVFTSLVAIRGTIALLAGPRLAATVGSFLQFAFVVMLLSFAFLSPAVWKIPSAVLNNPIVTGWLPTSWFLGLFERLRGSSRAYFVPLGTRALVATAIAVVAAVVVSMLGYRRQMQFALARPTPSGHGLLRVLRAIARTIAGRAPVARATSDFVLLTIARSRSQHTPIAMNVAIGAAVAIAALTRTKTIEALMHPRTIVLWIPLLVAYWLTIGVRAAAFFPSELPAAWSFRSAAPDRTRAYWSGTRAAMIAMGGPAVLLTAVLVTTPLLGWRIALWHALFAIVIFVTIVEIIALTMRTVPFTTPYQPGHARLRSRWPIYFFGMFVAALWPVRIELRMLGGHELAFLGGLLVVAAGFHLAGRRAASRWSVEPREELADDGWDIAVLDIGRVVHRAHVGG